MWRIIQISDTHTYTQLAFKVTHTHTLTPSVNSHRLWCYYTLSLSAAQPLALLWPWSILFEVIIASTLLPTTENERVREWLWRMWWLQPPCLHSLTTTHTHSPRVPCLSMHTPVLSICALSTASAELVMPTVLQAASVTLWDSAFSYTYESLSY